MVWLFGSIFAANLITWLPIISLGILIAVLGEAHTLAFTIPFLSFQSETVIHPILVVFLVGDIKLAISNCCRLTGRRHGEMKRQKQLPHTN